MRSAELRRPEMVTMLRWLRSVSGQRTAEDERWASEVAAWIDQMRAMDRMRERPRPRPKPYPRTYR